MAMTPALWEAKKICDATLHPDTGTPVFLPLRMSTYIFTNLVVTAGMLQPNLTTRGVLAWQIANQTLNVCINSANANKSSPLSYTQLGTSFVLAVSASCGVAVGLGKAVANLRVADMVDGKKAGKGVTPGLKMVLGRLVPFAAVVTAGVVNVGLMRGGEIASGIDVYATKEAEDAGAESLGKSRKAAILAVGETALSRVINATPIMVVPPMLLMRLQRSAWMKRNPGAAIPVNIGEFAIPLARFEPLLTEKLSSSPPPCLHSLWLSASSRSARLSLPKSSSQSSTAVEVRTERSSSTAESKFSLKNDCAHNRRVEGYAVDELKAMLSTS